MTIPALPTTGTSRLLLVNTASPFCGATANTTLGAPGALVFDSKGNLYVADYGNSVVYMITSAGKISTFAGTGTYGNSGDGGPASKAALAYPVSLTFDAAGNLYIGDEGNSNIRKVDTSGNISTVVTGVNAVGFGIDAAGYFYYVDGVSSTVRKVLPGGGVVTIAGNGQAAFSGDNGPGSLAQVSRPAALTFGPGGILYIADTGNSLIRTLTPVASSIGVQDAASQLPGSESAAWLYLAWRAGDIVWFWSWPCDPDFIHSRQQGFFPDSDCRNLCHV